MQASIRTARRLRFRIQFCYWGLIGISVGLDLWRNPGQLHESRYLLWLASMIAFGVAASLICRSCMRQERIARALVVSGFQAACALLMAAVWPKGFEVGLLTMVAFQVGFIIPLRSGVAWVLTQTVAYLAIRFWGMPFDALIANSLGMLAFQLLALTTAHFWGREAAAKRDLIRTNDELRLSQELLASTSRLAERQRISRELHDLLGHHLTAISLNLEVASHLADGKVAEHIRTAHDLSHQLLADVREAVSAIRDDLTIDLKQILHGFAGHIQSPRIHVAFPEAIDIGDPVRAHTLLRCAQEIITNAIRHASAQNLWLEVTRSGDGVVLKARDDGRGALDFQPGTGLTGMRERLEQVGGRLEVRPAPRDGFSIEAWLPMQEATT